MGMISRWIDAQDDEVLGRLARVPEGRWRAAYGFLDEHGGCLLAHASADGSAYESNTRDFRSLEEEDVALHFDDLCRRFGDARVGRLISERASRVLRERREKPIYKSAEGDMSQAVAGESAQSSDEIISVPVSVHVSLPTLGEALRPEIVTAYVEAHVSLNCEPVEVVA